MNKAAKSRLLYVPRIQDGYEIKINEEVFRISLTK